MSKNKITFLALLFFSLACLEYFYQQSQVADLQAILFPVKFLVASFTHSEWLSRSDGYFSPAHQILIDKSCSGIHFLMTAWALFSFSLVPLQKDFLGKSKICFILLLFSYLLSIFANASRIILVIFLSPFHQYNTFVSPKTLHELEGAAIYFSFLLLAFFLVRYFFQKLNKAS